MEIKHVVSLNRCPPIAPLPLNIYEVSCGTEQAYIDPEAIELKLLTKSEVFHKIEIMRKVAEMELKNNRHTSKSIEKAEQWFIDIDTIKLLMMDEEGAL